MLQRFCRLVKSDWILKLRPSPLLKAEVQNGSNKTNSCCCADCNTGDFASGKTCSKNKKNNNWEHPWLCYERKILLNHLNMLRPIWVKMCKKLIKVRVTRSNLQILPLFQ